MTVVSLVLKASFSKIVILILTLGCAAIYSLAISCQSVLPGSMVVICHHSTVTCGAAVGASVALGASVGLGASLGLTSAGLSVGFGACVAGAAAGAHAVNNMANTTSIARTLNNRRVFMKSSPS